MLIALLVGGAVFVVIDRLEHRPRPQTVHLMLGNEAPGTQAIEIQYEGASGETVREARLQFPGGKPPRVVSHEPELPDGDYTLEIDVEHDGARTHFTRRVTLSGGAVQVRLDPAD